MDGVTPLVHIPGGKDQDRDDVKIYGVSKVFDEAVFAQLVLPNFAVDIKGELQTLLPNVVSPTLGRHRDKKS